MNKKKLAFLIVILILILLGIFIIIKCKNNKDENISMPNKQAEITDENIENIFNINSSERNPIEKNGVEATALTILKSGDQLEVKTTLKNKTEEDINGYFIEIELLDANGNKVTAIASNSKDSIKAGESIEICNYVSGLENQNQIKGARIKELSKLNMQDSIEKTFDDMEPEEEF